MAVHFIYFSYFHFQRMGGQSLGFLMWYPPKLQRHAFIHNRCMSFRLAQSMCLLSFQKYLILNSHAKPWMFMLNLAVCWKCYSLLQFWELQSIVFLRVLNCPIQIIFSKSRSSVLPLFMAGLNWWWIYFFVLCWLCCCKFVQLSISRAEASRVFGS